MFTSSISAVGRVSLQSQCPLNSHLIGNIENIYNPAFKRGAAKARRPLTLR